MKPLTSGELEVMKILWEHGSLKPTEIQERFPRLIKNAALRAALLVLLEKGHVTRKMIGTAYYYKTKTPRQGTFKKMVRHLTNVFCEGSPTTLITQLIQIEKLSDEDIRELQRITTQIAKRRHGRKKGDAK